MPINLSKSVLPQPPKYNKNMLGMLHSYLKKAPLGKDVIRGYGFAGPLSKELISIIKNPDKITFKMSKEEVFNTQENALTTLLSLGNRRNLAQLFEDVPSILFNEIDIQNCVSINKELSSDNKNSLIFTGIAEFILSNESPNLKSLFLMNSKYDAALTHLFLHEENYKQIVEDVVIGQINKEMPADLQGKILAKVNGNKLNKAEISSELMDLLSNTDKLKKEITMNSMKQIEEKRLAELHDKIRIILFESFIPKYFLKYPSKLINFMELEGGRKIVMDDGKDRYAYSFLEVLKSVD